MLAPRRHFKGHELDFVPLGSGQFGETCGETVGGCVPPRGPFHTEALDPRGRALGAAQLAI
jgi:hypothetical protein